jgi:hypothetical protein
MPSDEMDKIVENEYIRGFYRPARGLTGINYLPAESGDCKIEMVGTFPERS